MPTKATIYNQFTGETAEMNSGQALQVLQNHPEEWKRTPPAGKTIIPPRKQKPVTTIEAANNPSLDRPDSFVPIAPHVAATGLQPEPEVEPAEEEEPADDVVVADLMEMEGVGRKLAIKLADKGQRLQTLAVMTDAEREKLQDDLRLHGAMRRKDWQTQAQAILAAREPAPEPEPEVEPDEPEQQPGE